MDIIINVQIILNGILIRYFNQISIYQSITTNLCLRIDES